MDEPVTKLDERFSDPGAQATPWATAREVLETAQLSWVTTVRADGRPHVTPLVAVWLDDAVHLTTGPGGSEPFERGPVGHALGLALDHHVQPLVPPVAAGGHDDVRVAGQVHGLLLARAGGEVHGVVQPHRHQRCDVRPPVAANRRDPRQLGRLQDLSSLRPRRRLGSGAAEPLVELRYRFLHLVPLAEGRAPSPVALPQ